MSSAEKTRLITDNVVQTTLHFQKKIEKILRLIMIPGYLEKGSDSSNNDSNCGDDIDDDNNMAPSYFYR